MKATTPGAKSVATLTPGQWLCRWADFKFADEQSPSSNTANGALAPFIPVRTFAGRIDGYIYSTREGTPGYFPDNTTTSARQQKTEHVATQRIPSQLKMADLLLPIVHPAKQAEACQDQRRRPKWTRARFQGPLQPPPPIDSMAAKW